MILTIIWCHSRVLIYWIYFFTLHDVIFVALISVLLIIILLFSILMLILIISISLTHISCIFFTDSVRNIMSLGNNNPILFGTILYPTKVCSDSVLVLVFLIILRFKIMNISGFRQSFLFPSGSRILLIFSPFIPSFVYKVSNIIIICFGTSRSQAAPDYFLFWTKPCL